MRMSDMRILYNTPKGGYLVIHTRAIQRRLRTNRLPVYKIDEYLHEDIPVEKDHYYLTDTFFNATSNYRLPPQDTINRNRLYKGG